MKHNKLLKKFKMKVKFIAISIHQILKILNNTNIKCKFLSKKLKINWMNKCNIYNLDQSKSKFYKDYKFFLRLYRNNFCNKSLNRKIL